MSWFKRMDSSNLETGDDQLDNDVMEQVLLHFRQPKTFVWTSASLNETHKFTFWGLNICEGFNLRNQKT